MREIESLWGAAEGTDDGDRLDILATLVDAYEEKRWPADGGDPIDMLRFAIDEMGRSQTELEAMLGSRSRALDVLARRRPLSVDMIHRISTAWRIPASLLIRPYPIVSRPPSPRARVPRSV